MIYFYDIFLKNKQDNQFNVMMARYQGSKRDLVDVYSYIKDNMVKTQMTFRSRDNHCSLNVNDRKQNTPNEQGHELSV